MSVRSSYAIYAITKHGVAIGRRLLESLPGATLFVSERLFATAPPGSRPLGLPMGPTLAATWKEFDCHVHVISVGAVVRMVAPLLEDKKVDPAIVCVDDDARFAICVLSGHVGRGNEFAVRVANALDATPVVTTASDVRGTLTVDVLGRELGWVLADPDRNVTRGSAAVVNEEDVAFVQETGEPDFWPLDRSLPKGIVYVTSLDVVDPSRFAMLLVASDRRFEATHPSHHEHSVVYRPKSLCLGIGCDRGTPTEVIERGIRSILESNGLAFESISCLATVTKKADEPGLVALSSRHGWPIRIYSASELASVEGVATPSVVVERHVGTPSVSEAAALSAASTSELLVRKTIYTEPGVGRSMTLAVARRPFAKRVEGAEKSADEKERVA